METYPTGARRSSHKPYYREIPFAVWRRLGEALRKGALKYNEKPWESNWQKGDLSFALDCIDHLGEHFACYAESVKARLAGKPTRDEEDHLGHLLANAAFLSWFEEQGMFQPPREGTNTNGPDEDEEIVDPLLPAGPQSIRATAGDFFERIFAPKK